MMYDNIAVIGSSGAIGSALIRQLTLSQPKANIHAFCRWPSAKQSLANVFHYQIDYSTEQSIANAANIAAAYAPLDLVVVATGILHDGKMMPEKSLRDLSAEKFQHVFAINTILPALIAKAFLPKLKKNERAIFAALSARVGSISDNYLGGWYAYRASKAALNMIIKNAAIEMQRRYPCAIIVGLHPGTVDTDCQNHFDIVCRR